MESPNATITRLFASAGTNTSLRNTEPSDSFPPSMAMYCVWSPCFEITARLRANECPVTDVTRLGKYKLMAISEPSVTGRSTGSLSAGAPGAMRIVSFLPNVTRRGDSDTTPAGLRAVPTLTVPTRTGARLPQDSPSNWQPTRAPAPLHLPNETEETKR